MEFWHELVKSAKQRRGGGEIAPNLHRMMCGSNNLTYAVIVAMVSHRALYGILAML